jgi:starch synthase
MFCQLDMLKTPSILMTDVTPLQYDRMAALYDHSVDESPLVRAAKHAVNVLNFRLAAGFAVCSNWVRASLIAEYGVPAHKIHVIPIGIDTEYWSPGSSSKQPGAVRLLFVGGHFERKGGQLLLEVFRSLGLKDRAELHVVTRDPIQPEPGVFVHRGIQNNSPGLRQLYRDADVFVLPTLADCFGNASLEAMGAGLPVITTAMGGIPDIVDHGQTGFLLEPGNGQQLAHALLRLVDSTETRTAFGVASRQRALTHFDARTNAARILGLAEHVGARRRANSSRATKPAYS